ncbi:MAG: hypothetical protein KF901_19915 [Myxococcales bacterium]|nr:hypothetical protein [Myxococcales bacterium]
MQANAMGMTSHKMSRCVRHRHMRIVLDGHDVGMMLGHVSLPPVNVLTPSQIIGSARKAFLSARKVQIDGKPVASCEIMMACANPTSMPAAMSVLRCTNTVVFGMDWVDYVRGILLAVGQALIELGVSKLFETIKAPDVTGGQVPNQMVWEALFSAAFGHGASLESALTKIFKDVLGQAAGNAVDGAIASAEGERHVGEMTLGVATPVFGTLGVVVGGSSPTEVENLGAAGLSGERGDSQVGPTGGRRLFAEAADRRRDDDQYWATVENGAQHRAVHEARGLVRDPLSAVFYRRGE